MSGAGWCRSSRACRVLVGVGARNACQVLVGVGAHTSCQVLVGVGVHSACQALALVSATKVRQSPVLVRHWYVPEKCEVLVRHWQPGRGGSCKFPKFPCPQELRYLAGFGGVTMFK